jgi:hypothetical protein
VTRQIFLLDVADLHPSVFLALLDELFDHSLTQTLIVSPSVNVLILLLNSVVRQDLLIFLCQLFQNLFKVHVFLFEFSL